jgi:2-oxoglutarate dehydrogenase E2 component (dihydrolipoamide succinyltransferase)
VLESITANPGDTVNVGALIGAIGAAGSVAAAAPAAAAKPADVPQPAAVAAEPAPKAGNGNGATGSMAPAPSAQKLMAESGVSEADVSGSGKRGQILKEDVLAAIAKPAVATAGASVAMPTAVSGSAAAPIPAAKPAPVAAPAAAPAPVAKAAEPAPAVPAQARGPVNATDDAREERVKMTRLRQTIARRLKEAQNNAAMLTTFNEVDMTTVMALRGQYKDVFEKKHGVKLGFMSFFTKAVVAALKAVPDVNAEIDGTDIVYKNHYDIGVAVGTDKGLVVPVVRDADTLSLAEIEKAIGALGKKARDGQLAIEDMQGGTFTITNGGIYGSLMSTPILNAPQSGILGMHAIKERAMVVNGKIEIRPMMYLALSYDHRVVDGQGAVTFLVKVKEALEDPQRLLLEL